MDSLLSRGPNPNPFPLGKGSRREKKSEPLLSCSPFPYGKGLGVRFRSNTLVTIRSAGPDPMLYLLLYPLHTHFVGFGVLRYETFRSVMAGLGALALSLALGPILIERFRAAHVGQTIRDEVPQTHQKKAGTPTMGGLLILASAAIATILLADLRDPYVWITLFVAITFGAVGLTDDMMKLKRGRGQGISGRKKLGWSFVFAAIAAVVSVRPDPLRYPSDDSLREESASRSALVGIHSVRDFRNRRVARTRST